MLVVFIVRIVACWQSMVPVFGVPIIRMIVYWGFMMGSPCFWKLPPMLVLVFSLHSRQHELTVVKVAT